jgi:hypothetical protein
MVAPLARLLCRYTARAMRRRRIWLLVGVVALALVGVGLAVLPGVARRVAVSQLTTLTGRDVAIDDLRLNLFTRRVGLTGFRIGDGPGRPPFVELERLDVEFRLLPLLRGRVHLTAVGLVRPVVRIVRTGPSEFNFSDILARLGKGEPAKEPAPFTLGRLALVEGAVIAEDRAVSPPVTWEVRGLTAEARDVTTVAGGPEGTAKVSLTLAGAPITVVADRLRGHPAHARATVTVTGLDLARLIAYIPPDAPVRLARGTFGTELHLEYDAAGGARAGGTATLTDVALARTESPHPFEVVVPALAMDSRDVVYKDGVVTAGRLEVKGEPTVTDRSLTPPRTYTIAATHLVVEALSYPTQAPGRMTFTAGLPGNGSLDVRGAVAAHPPEADLAITIAGLDLALARPYVPPTVPVAVTSGRLRSALRVAYARDATVRVSGDVAVADLAVLQAGQTEPVLRQRLLETTLTDVVLRDGAVSAARIAIAGAPSLADTSVTPPRRLDLRALRVAVEGATWPPQAPARVQFAAQLPEAGALEGRGTVALDRRTAALTLRLADAALGPYAAFLPIDAPLGGRADAELAVTAGFGDALAVGARGTLTARTLAVGPADAPLLRIERVAVTGLDADWPRAVRVARVAITRPSALVERAADGTFPLRTMLTPRTAAPPAEAPRAAPAASDTKPAPALAIEVGEVVIEDGAARFVDRTLTPVYSEEITRLAVSVRNFSSAPDRRADLAVQALVGGTGSVDLKGQAAPLGQPFFVDIGGELRDFPIPRTNPYVQRLLDWVIGSGRLTTKVHYRIVGDQLEATNDIVVQRLQVQRAAAGPEADRKIGIPLALVVSLLKDGQGDIRLSVPVGGKMSAPEFSFASAIGTALRNIVTNLVKAPFRAIGRVFSKGDDDALDELKVDPVRFPAGSAAVTPEGEGQLRRVADFLRASPQVRLGVQPVVTAADAAALRVQQATARIQRVQREATLPDFAAAAARVHRELYPGRPLPERPEDVVAAIRDAEPAPEAAARELAARRLEATRQALVGAAGIEGARLAVREGALALGADGEGRVEFELAPGE